MPFDGEATLGEDVWKNVAEVAIGEEYETQAARS
jgi:hypothetical protein